MAVASFSIFAESVEGIVLKEDVSFVIELFTEPDVVPAWPHLPFNRNSTFIIVMLKSFITKINILYQSFPCH